MEWQVLKFCTALQICGLTMSIKVIFGIIKLYDVVRSLNILLEIFVEKYSTQQKYNAINKYIISRCKNIKIENIKITLNNSTSTSL